MSFVLMACSISVNKAEINPKTDINPEIPVVDNNGVRLKVGDVAPDFTLSDINGKQVSLSDFRGKKVVLNTWWMRCHGCTDEMPYFQEFYMKRTGQGLILLALNVYDSSNLIRPFSATKKLTFPLLIDPDKRLNQIYINSGVPTTFFIDKEGVIRAIKDGGFENVGEIEEMYNSY